MTIIMIMTRTAVSRSFGKRSNCLTGIFNHCDSLCISHSVSKIGQSPNENRKSVSDLLHLLWLRGYEALSQKQGYFLLTYLPVRLCNNL